MATKMYIGSNEIGKMYIGSSEILKLYKGVDLVFEPGAILPPNVIPIYTAQDLQAINSSSYKANLSKIFMLMNDIDCSSISNFTSITGFGSVFDGNGFKITNFNSTSNGLISTTINYLKVSTFETFSKTTIRNVGISGTVSAAAKQNVGMLVGSAQDTVIYNCYANGSVTGSINTGGLVGLLTSGTVKNCYSTATVTSSYENIGGLVGKGEGGCVVSLCYATGNVNTYSYGGGFVGRLSGTVSNSYTTSDVNGAGGNIYAFDGFTSFYAPDEEPGDFLPNTYAYAGQLVKGTPVNTSNDGAPAYIATLAQLQTTTWHKNNLLFNDAEWLFQDGYYPKLKTHLGVEMPGQTWVAIT